MKICFVYKEDYPWDVRVEKIVDTLQNEGHHVTLLCRNTKGLPRKEICKEGLAILRLPDYSRLFGLFGKIIDVPFYLNPIWFFYILRAVNQSGAKLLIVRDLPLMPCSLLVARILGLKVLFDMAECYPEMYKSELMFSKGLKKIKNSLIRNYKIAAFFERISVMRANHIFVMIEESLNRLILMKVPEKKITIVSNTPVIKNKLNYNNHSGYTIKLLYVGFLSPMRGLDNMLFGIAEFYNQEGTDEKVYFDIAGVGDEYQNLIKLSRFLEIERYVCFHGWVNHNLLPKLYRSSNVGVLLHRVTPHVNNTIPNKLFDYMLYGLPVLASNAEPIKRIINTERCGIIIENNDHIAIANALRKLADPMIRQEMGDNGKQAILHKYNWMIDSRRMFNVITNLDQ